MGVAVKFENVSKRFILHPQRPRSLQEMVIETLKGNRSSKQELWALKDLTFEVQEGETLGIVGPNGAGKSTLLKLMARILDATSGRMTVNGKVAALLELGTGFHPDLTGRENIFLNGSLLGLSRRDMLNKFDEIVEFAELAQFIDVPVKHYSSGMLIRLGFSIATNVDPDILLIDEVLAVGDQHFQAKCLARMEEIKEKKTIIFVSHSLETVRGICHKAIWLDRGVLRATGEPERVTDLYRQSVTGDELALEEKRRWGTREVEIVAVRFLDTEGEERSLFETGEKMVARIEYEAHTRVERPVFGVAIYRNDGLQVNGPNTKASDFPIPWLEGKGQVHYVIDALPLLEGTYEFSASVYDHYLAHAYDHHHRLYSFGVKRGGTTETQGFFYIPSRWEHRRE